MASPGGVSTRNVSPTLLIDGLRVRPRRRAVAIGTFDGVHLGHARVIVGCDTVLTFDPHPRSVLQPGNVPRLLTDAAGKRRRLATLGVREIVVIPFDREWAARLPARALRNGHLMIDSALAIPRPGRYTVTVGGAATRATVSENGAIELGRWPTRRSVEVSFLSRI